MINYLGIWASGRAHLDARPARPVSRELLFTLSLLVARSCFVVCPLPPATRRSWCSSSVWPYQYQAWEWGTANEVPHPKNLSLSHSHLFALPRACHQGVLKDPPPGVPPHCLVNKVIFHVCFSSPFYYIKEALSPPLLYKSCPLLYKESVPVRKPMLGWPCRAFPLVPYGFLWAFYGAPYGPRTS